MPETISVLFKVGHARGASKISPPDPQAIESALRSFLMDSIPAADIGKKLGLPTDISVRYEVQWLDHSTARGEKIPLHVSIRGPKEIVDPLYAKLKTEFGELLLDNLEKSNIESIFQGFGISPSQPVDFQIYAS